MTTPEELLPEPIEPDPTGMRALLSSLPDPGPMPEGLEAQILARLAELRTEDGPRGLPQPPTRDHEADIVPLVAYGTDRPDRPRWLAAVAGIAAAAVLGIVVTDGLKGGGWVSSVVGGGSADSAAGGAAGPSAESKGAADGAGRRDVFSASGTDYRAATLREQASALLVRSVSMPADAAADPTVAECLSALGVTSADAPVVDRASYEGRPAYVVVWTRGGRASVVVTDTSCGPSGAHVVTGPTGLG
jgi:hypothetical protein